MPNFKTSTPDEIRACTRPNNGRIAFAACRKGAQDRMPLTPSNARNPWKKTPLLRGLVVAISRDGARVRIESDHGQGGWVDFSDLLFDIDTI
jgi:hypothetical protein